MKQLDPKAVWLFFITAALRLCFPAFFLGIWFSGALSIFTGWSDRTDLTNQPPALPTDFFVYAFLFFLLFLILCFVWAKLAYGLYRYELVDMGFRKESGVIFKRYVTIPYDRIQNVDIYRGPIARILGLSDLQIQTAGSSAVMGRYGAAGMSAEGRLPGLSHAVAEELRDELIRRAHQPKNQGL